MTFDTIVAPATPPGYGGVSIVRISGNIALNIGRAVSGKTLLKNRYSTLTNLIDEKNLTIDSVLLTYFKGPGSYTGEDIIEISCHGNPIIVDRIISVVLSRGARLANPGEFTMRAFLNGKLDLVQAESVGGLIGSRSVRATELSNNILSGNLSNKLLKIKDNLIGSLSFLEFEFDISEDTIINKNTLKELNNALNNNIIACNELLSTYAEGTLYNNGARVVICGEPNVGKSTLLNALLDRDRAITSNAPGTTRDSIESNILLSGIPVVLVDTAGIRPSVDDVESSGIKRTINEIKNANLIINLFSGDSQPIEYIDDSDRSLFVFNKDDVFKNHSQDIGAISISALNKTGIEKLKIEIFNKLVENNNSTSDIILTTRRQYNSIKRCGESLERGLSILCFGEPELELVAFELRDSINHIDTLLGKTSVDDILNRVFSGFCVGK